MCTFKDTICGHNRIHGHYLRSQPHPLALGPQADASRHCGYNRIPVNVLSLWVPWGPSGSPMMGIPIERLRRALWAPWAHGGDLMGPCDSWGPCWGPGNRQAPVTTAVPSRSLSSMRARHTCRCHHCCCWLLGWQLWACLLRCRGPMGGSEWSQGPGPCSIRPGPAWALAGPLFAQLSGRHPTKSQTSNVIVGQ